MAATTPQRVTVFWQERPRKYQASCNVCAWECRSKRRNLGSAQTDARRHAKAARHD